MQEADKILVRMVTILAHARRKELGLPPARAGYGFMLVGPRGRRRLVPDEYTRDCGQKFLEWRRKGFSWASIYLHLWHHKVRTRDGREWSYGSIRRAVEAEQRLQEQEAREQVVAAESGSGSF
jgi:hypothetical protein